MNDANTSASNPAFWNRHRGKLIIMQGAVFLLLGYWLADTRRGHVPQNSSGHSSHPSSTASDVEWWTCSMHPQIRQPKPGKCPICGMELVPVAKSAGGMRTLELSPPSKALLQIETQPVERRYVTQEIRMVGRIDYDETKLGYITAWVSGRLDRLFVDYTGVEVQKGDHLASIYSEELLTAQEELILALKSRRANPQVPDSVRIQPIDLVQSAREKLRLLGLTEDQIATIEKQVEPSDHITIFSPLSGIVIDKLKQQGDRVRLGERIYTVADLSEVWIHLDAYEAELPWIRYGQKVEITAEAYPGETFYGHIAFIQPVLNTNTRTVKVRVNASNKDGRLKPGMFVHGIVRAKMAAEGKVMDPSLAGKWISPMHPEIVKDHPGKCDICGMPLVRAESLGYVTAEANSESPPLVIPYSAALVTGTRAVVYVQLPVMPTFAEPALQTLRSQAEGPDLSSIQNAFRDYSKKLDQPYDQNGTRYAKEQWKQLVAQLQHFALAGQRSNSPAEASKVLGQIELTMEHARELYSSPNRPTYEGREIVLGPRASDFYLVRHGLQEGELVVTQGNFKIDSEIQIQAKPSMMTPEGGGGGGHQHGGHSGPVGGKTAVPKSSMDPLPASFLASLAPIESAFQHVADEVVRGQLEKQQSAYRSFGDKLAQIPSNDLAGHARMQWKEISMLLSNDAAEGSDAKTQADADRVFLLLKGHMRRLRQVFPTESAHNAPSHTGHNMPDSLATNESFQQQLRPIWDAYRKLSGALANDDLPSAQRGVHEILMATSKVDVGLLPSASQNAATRELANLKAIAEKAHSDKETEPLRASFALLSQEIGILARQFGFGPDAAVFELHCPMAFDGTGAVWYQDNERTRNPYFGTTMLECSDRVEPVKTAGDPPPPANDTDHSPEPRQKSAEHSHH